MGDDLSILLTATLDINKSVTNINKQILEVQTKLKEVNISLNLGNVQAELEKVAKTAETSFAKVAKQDLSFKSLPETTQEIKNLSKNLDNIYADLKQIGNVKSLKNVYNDDGSVKGFTVQLETIKKGLKEVANYNVFGQLNAETGEMEYALTKVNSTMKEVAVSAEKVETKTKKSTQADYYNNLLTHIHNYKLGLMSVEDYINRIQTLIINKSGDYNGFFNNQLTDKQQEQIVRELNSALKERDKILRETESINQKIIASNDKQYLQAVNQNIALKKINDDLTKAQTLYGSSVDSIKAKEIQETLLYLSKLPPETAEYKAKLKEVRYEQQKLSNESKSAFKKAQDAISDTTAKTTSLGLAMRTLGQLFMIGSPIFLAREIFNDMATSINEVNKALTDIQIVTGMSVEDADKLAQSYNELGVALGATTNEMLTGATEWFRQGKTMAETQELITASMIGAKLSGIESAEMTEYLTSALNGYKMEATEAISVVDKLVAVDNAAATSVEELAVAMARTSSTAQMVGVNMDDLISYIGTVSSVSRRSAETIGESFRTIFTRFQNIKLGEFVDDGMVASDVRKALGNIGIELMATETEFRDFGDVVEELTGKWHTLSEAEISSVSAAMAGTRQRENFLILMENMTQVQDLATISLGSNGLALDRYGIYLDSTEAAINRFKASAEALFMETLSSNTINNIINIGTAIIKLTTDIGGLVPVLTSIIVLITIVKSKSIASGLLGIGGALLSVAKAMGSVLTITKGATTAMIGFQATTGWIGLLAIAITGVTSAMSYMSKETERAREEMSVLNDEIQESTINHGNAQELAQRYEELSKLTKEQGLTNEEAQEYTNIQNELHKLMPEISGYIDEHGNFIATEAKMLEEVNKHYREYIALKREEKAEKATDILDNSITQYQDDMRELEKLQSNLGVYEKHEAGFELTVDEQKFINATKQMGDFGETVEWTKDKINELQTDSNKSLSELRQDLIDATGGTEAWENATDKQQEALQKMLSSIDSSYIENYSEHLKSLEAQGMTTQDALDELAKVLFGDSMFLGYFTSEVDTATDSISEYDQAIETTTDSMEAYLELVSEFADGLSEIDDAIETLAEGNELTAEQIVNLRNQHESLNPVLDETTGRYTIELEELLKLRDGYIDVSENGIKAEITLTKQALQSTLDRIDMYKLEIEAIESRQDAYKAIESMTTDKMIDMFGHNGYRSIADNFKSEDERAIEEGLYRLGELQEQLQNMSIYSANGISTSSSPKSDSSSSSIADEIDDQFAKAIEAIQKNRDALDREIAEVDAQINVANATGDMESLTALSDKMNLLLKQRIEETAIQNEKYEGLKKLYATEEQLLELETLMSDNAVSANADTVDKIELEIEALERKHAIQTAIYDAQIKQFEYEQMLYASDSDEYIAIEQKKLDIIYEKRKVAEEMYQALKAQGLADEHELVQEYKNAWYDYEIEIRQMQLDMAQIRKDREQELLESQQESLENLIDYTMDMLRDQYEEEQDMINEKYDLEEERLNDQLDAKRKAIEYEKSLLQDESDERSYNQGLEDRKQEISNIQNQMSLLEMVDTLEAQKEYEELFAELQEQLEDLDNYQYEHHMDKTNDALDDELAAYEESIENQLDMVQSQKDKELAIVESQLDSETKLRQEAIALIESRNQSLYNQLNQWAIENGDVTEQEISSAWDGANNALMRYEDTQYRVLETLAEIASELDYMDTSGLGDWIPDSGSSSSSSSSSGSSSNNDVSTSVDDKLTEYEAKIKAQANEQKYLHNQMVTAKEEGLDGYIEAIKKLRPKYGLNPDDGGIDNLGYIEDEEWDRIKSRYGFMNGGITNRTGLHWLDGELNEPERVLSASQNKAFERMVEYMPKFNDAMSRITNNNTGSSVHIEQLMHVDKIDKGTDIDGLMSKMEKKIYNIINKPLKQRGILGMG